MPLLSVEHLTLHYDDQGPAAVNDLSFAIEKGEIFALLGPSGSGKTSALRLIGGFEHPEGGRIVLNGTEIEGHGKSVPPEQRNVGFVFQEFALFPHMTVLQNVMYGLKGMRKKEREGLALDILERAQLKEHAPRYPMQLSGGQQQRVALARAMAPRPHLILLDEPFGSLDPDLRHDAQDKILSVFRDRNMTAIMVTHDQEEALSFADRIGVMRDGRIEQTGTPEELYNTPRTRFVAAFIGGANIFKGQSKGDCAMTSIGRIPLDTEATGEVTVAIRPEHLKLSQPKEGSPIGLVTGRMFHGHDLTIRVRIDDSEVRVWDDYRCPFQLGQSVSVVPRENGIVVADGAPPESTPTQT